MPHTLPLLANLYLSPDRRRTCRNSARICQNQTCVWIRPSGWSTHLSEERGGGGKGEVGVQRQVRETLPDPTRHPLPRHTPTTSHHPSQTPAKTPRGGRGGGGGGGRQRGDVPTRPSQDGAWVTFRDVLSNNSPHNFQPALPRPQHLTHTHPRERLPCPPRSPGKVNDGWPRGSGSPGEGGRRVGPRGKVITRPHDDADPGFGGGREGEGPPVAFVQTGARGTAGRYLRPETVP